MPTLVGHGQGPKPCVFVRKFQEVSKMSQETPLAARAFLHCLHFDRVFHVVLADRRAEGPAGRGSGEVNPPPLRRPNTPRPEVPGRLLGRFRVPRARPGLPQVVLGGPSSESPKTSESRQIRSKILEFLEILICFL